MRYAIVTVGQDGYRVRYAGHGLRSAVSLARALVDGAGPAPGVVQEVKTTGGAPGVWSWEPVPEVGACADCFLPFIGEDGELCEECTTRRTR